MGWKRLRRLAAISVTIGVVSGCGGAAITVSEAGSSIPASTKISDPTATAGYCQRMDDGDWVTNDSTSSTTPCVPDPSYATGDEQADASVAVPRCYTCKLADWKSAEKRASVQTGNDSAAPAVTSTATDNSGPVDEWSADIYTSFISNCTGALGGSECECLANHLEWRVPANQAQGLSEDDPRVQLALRDCRS